MWSRLAARAHGPRPWQQFVRRMFIQTETTPNPDSLKFLPGKSVLEAGTREFRSLRESQVSPLARKLFQTEGVSAIFLSTDFVTVSKETNADWMAIKPQIFAAIMDFYATNEPVLSEDGADESDSLTITDEDSEVVQMIKELLAMRIRPSVQEDGGDIVYRGFDEADGVVLLQMQGSCAGCPSSSVTLKAGIENMLMHYIPEVREVRAIESDDDEDDIPVQGFGADPTGEMIRTKPASTA
mmetsp:Transcript_55497/g.91906  ORF Transcript_55497/g.91906 Transcript_55497/m.91906 type:complete len:240 (-) Transcript_55497:475-1194(-)